MELSKAIEHYGTATKLAEALNVTPQAVCNWKARGTKVPKPYALELHFLTGGKLKFYPKAYE